MLRSLLLSLWRLPRNLVIGIIRTYQLTLSPDHGLLRFLWTYGYCRHEPTCSMYAIEKLRRLGLVAGIVLGVIRILSCNPFRKPSEEKLRSLAEQQLHRQE